MWIRGSRDWEEWVASYIGFDALPSCRGLIGNHDTDVDPFFLAAALAFDLFFTEVQLQIATGRLPYRVLPSHTAYALDLYWATDACLFCGCMDPREAGPCRAFHPRQP